MCWTVLLAASTVMVMASAVGPETPPRQWPLPGPDRKGKMTLEAALARRRSIRQYARGADGKGNLSALLGGGRHH